MCERLKRGLKLGSLSQSHRSTVTRLIGMLEHPKIHLVLKNQISGTNHILYTMNQV